VDSQSSLNQVSEFLQPDRGKARVLPALAQNRDSPKPKAHPKPPNEQRPEAKEADEDRASTSQAVPSPSPQAVLKDPAVLREALQTVMLKMAVKNLDYQKIQADPDLQQELEESIKKPVATEAAVPLEAVAVKLRQGSVMAEVIVTPPEDVDVEQIQSNLASSQSLSKLVLKSLSEVDGVDEVSSGDLVVSVISKPQIHGLRPGKESDAELEEEAKKEAEWDEEKVSKVSKSVAKEEDEDEKAEADPEKSVKDQKDEISLPHHAAVTEHLRKLIVKETNYTNVAGMLAGMSLDLRKIDERMAAMEKDVQDGVKLEAEDPTTSLIFPLSVCMRCVLMLAAQYFIIYSSVALVKAFTDLFGLGDSTMCAVVLQQAAETVFYAPMLCVLFLGAQLRAFQITQDKAGPQPLTELAMQACTWSVFVQTFMALSVPIFLGRTAFRGSKDRLDLEVPGQEGRAVAGLLTLIRYCAMGMLYVGFIVVSVQVLLMDTRSLGAEPLDLWDNPTTVAVEYAPPLSAAMASTMSLTMLFFAVYLALAVGHSCVELLVVPSETLLGIERALASAAKVVDLAPMLCILFVVARLRALTIDPKTGSIPHWVELSMYTGVVSLTGLVFAALLRAMLEHGGVIPGDQTQLASSITKTAARITAIARWIFTLGAYGSALLVIAATLALRAVEVDGRRPVTPPLSPTSQCGLFMVILYFAIYLALFFFEAQSRENLELAELVGAALQSAESAVKFCPMLALLFISARVRALHISEHHGSPQCWAQDAMYVISGCIFAQLLAVLLTAAFFDTASSGAGDGDQPGESRKTDLGRVILEALKVLMLFAIHGGALVIVASMLTIQPETATCQTH